MVVDESYICPGSRNILELWVCSLEYQLLIWFVVKYSVLHSELKFLS